MHCIACCCCCCCSAYLSPCYLTASDANLFDDQHIFHCNDNFVIGEIRTCLGVSDDPIFLQFFSTEFAACLKPPNIDNYRKASHRWTQQRDQGAG